MKNITNKDLKRMIELMGNKTPINESKLTSSIELVKKAPNGKFYGVVRETKKYYIKESNDGSNFDFIGGVANKNKNQFESYEQAVRRLNLMLEDTDVLTPDIITEKKFVIKTKKKKTEEPTEDTGFGGDAGFGDSEEKDEEETGFGAEETEFGSEETGFGADEEEKDEEETGFGSDEEEKDEEEVGFGSDEEEKDEEETGFGADEQEEDEEEDYDLEDEEDPIKSIQRMTGKLGQKIRDTKDISSDMGKWVAKSVLSALNLEDMNSDDKKDLIRTIKKKKEESEESDFMGDDDYRMSDENMRELMGAHDEDDFVKDENEDMVDWNRLSAEEKAKIVNFGKKEKEYEIPNDCTHCNGLGHDDMTGEICEWCDGTGFNQNDEPETDYMDDETMYGPGNEPGNVLLDDDNEEDHCSYCNDRDTMRGLPYNEEEPYETYPGINEPDWRNPRMDYMGKYAKKVKSTEAGKPLESHEKEEYLKKVFDKLGGDNKKYTIDRSSNSIVGDFGHIKVGKNSYDFESNFDDVKGLESKSFKFNKLGEMKDYVRKIENSEEYKRKNNKESEDYMDDPYMMPQPAPAKPQTKPAPTKEPSTPDRKKTPFQPPVVPGTEPNPKAECEHCEGLGYDEVTGEECEACMGTGVTNMEYYMVDETDYMEEPDYYGSFDQKSWYGPKDMAKQLDGPSYEYEENEYPDYESFRKSKYGQDPSNKWFAQGGTGERMFNTYRDKFGPMKIRKKRNVNYDESSKMFDNLDYMDETDFDLGPKIHGRPSNNPIAARGNVSKTYLTDVQKRNREAKKQANMDISKHFKKHGDFHSHETPSDEWRQYPLPYDTKFGDVDFMEDDGMEICSACEGRGHEHGRIGFSRQQNPCITCAGTGKIPRMEIGGEVDEPYIDSANPMGYERGTSTLPKGMGHRYEYKEKFNFPFSLGENSRRNKKTLKEDHLNNKMASYEQDMAYEYVESMARERGMDVELCHKDRSKDPEEQTVYLDLMKKDKAVAKIRINSAGNIEMGHMTGKVFKGEPVDSDSDFDEVLAEKGIKMMPQPAPTRTRPETPTKPAPTKKPDTDKPDRKKTPFQPPVVPGTEPNPKAEKKKKPVSYMGEKSVPQNERPKLSPPAPPKGEKPTNVKRRFFNPPAGDDDSEVNKYLRQIHNGKKR